MERWIKPAFTVIGIEGAIGCEDATEDGFRIVGRLWAIANNAFDEVEHLAKRHPNGTLQGVWGAMSDCSRSFLPWEDDFTKGLYLASVEVRDDAQPPEGWVRWDVPGYEYLRAEIDNQFYFSRGIAYLRDHGIPLVGAAQEFTDPQNSKKYICFPIRKL